jgi:zinc protease
VPSTPASVHQFALRLLVVLALCAAPASARTPAAKSKAKAPAFPHEKSDLKPDPAAHFGKLPNGLRYVIRQNREPRGRVSMRLLVHAGSLHESDEQRGLAHFLEHMAFNGSEHYPPGTLIEFFQRMGMNFGGDTNASTGFDRTIYMLELAQSDTPTVDEGLRVFRDYAGGLLLTPEEINRERDVILAEKRARDSVAYRTFVARFEAMLGTTRFPHRMPIGTAETITSAAREQFKDFWNTWYRPERMVVVIVGDFAETAAVEQQLRDAFAELTPRAPARPEPSLGKLLKFDGVRPVFHHEPEAPSTTITISRLTPFKREPDTAKLRVQRLPRALAIAMLNRRFSILAKQENAPFISAGAAVSEQFDFMRDATVQLSAKPEQWSAALAAGEQELRRAVEHGFEQVELTEAAANLTNALEQAVKTAPTRRSPAIADEIVSSVFDGNVLTTPEAELALLRPALEKITPEDCVRALREDFSAPGKFVLVTGNAAIPGDAAAAITAAYEESRAVAVAPPEQQERNTWAYTDFGPPGEIVKREHVEDLDVHLVTFANGVRLNIKRTDFEAQRVSLSARIGNGSITEPPDRRGLAAIAGGTFTAGGLGKHSVDELRQILAGRNIGWSFAPDSDAFRFGGGTTPEDLQLQFEMLAALITDPGYREESLRQARKGIEQLYISFRHTVNGPLATEIANLLANGDPRFGMPPQEEMLARNLDEVREWLTPQFAEGAIEVAVVGDAEPDAIIAAAARTVGALPPRGPKPELAELKQITFPPEPFDKSYSIESEIPKGLLLVYWPTDDGLDVRRTRRFNLLSNVLNDRLRARVREEIGGTYSPRAGSNASDTFPGYGYISASIDIAPADAQKLTDLVIAIADDLARNGVSDDELTRAREPLMTSLRETLRQNGYWLTAVLSRAQERPEMLDWARTRMQDVESITKEELSEIARQFLSRERASRATVLPRPNEK